MRPDIVLYGEQPKLWQRAVDLIADAQGLIAIGTGLNMMPAADSVNLARRNGADIIHVNHAQKNV